MTTKEFQDKHGWDDESMARIKAACKVFKGKITRIMKENKDGSSKQ